MYVVGKHLAGLGLDFFHRDPIPHRYVVASLENGANDWIHFQLKITWCRFLRSNWYDSGGRFTKVLDWPPQEFVDFLRHSGRASVETSTNRQASEISTPAAEK